MRIRKRGTNAQPGESSAARPGSGSHEERPPAPATRAEREHNRRTAGDEVEHDATRIMTGRGEDEEEEELRGTEPEFFQGGARTVSRPSPTLVVDLWQRSGVPPEPPPHMNLDEFVSSLVRENCFPADDFISSRGCARDSSLMLGLMSTVQSDDPKFERLAGGSYAELDTSLRLGQASHHPAAQAPQDRGKRKMDLVAGLSKEFESATESDSRENFAPDGAAALESWNAEVAAEACDESDSAQRSFSNVEAAQLEIESSPSDHQTMKSSTESMEPRCSTQRRESSATDCSKRRRLSSPTAQTGHLLAADHPANQPRRSLTFSLYTVFHEAGRMGLTAADAMAIIVQQGLPGFEESEECRSRRHVTKLLRNSPYFMEIGEQKFALCSAMVGEEQMEGDDGDGDDDDPSQPDYEEEATEDSQYSSPEEENKFSKRSRKSTLPVSSSTLAIDNEKRKQEVEFQRNESGSIPVIAGGSSQHTETKETLTPKPKGSGRSGRPKKLKYLKQDNVEELGNQCNRSDGKGWTCPLLAKTGYQLCDHHLDKLRCKPGSRSKYNKKKKKHN